MRTRWNRFPSVGFLSLTSTARADGQPAIGVLLVEPAQLAAWLRDHDPPARASLAKVEQARALAAQAGSTGTRS
jgi:hypothetical protein